MYCLRFITFFYSLFLGSLVIAQQGDKANEKDIISSLNWKKWSPDVVPVFSAEESLKQFKVAPGFRVELVASEPMIKDPVFVDWDDQGRMWVGELRTYMRDLDGTGENERMSRVMVLEDTDKDGVMDKATPFVDDMINVRCIAFVDDGVLVVESGALWLCKDKDGDLRCDDREKLIDFATAAQSNIEHAENALHFALDNWMYNSKSSRKLAWRKGKLIEMPAKARGQWGMGSDAYGRLYFNANSNWFEVDWATYDRQWPSKGSSVKPPTNRVFGIRPNTALNRNYRPGRILEDGRVASVTTISGLAVHSHGAYGKDWEGAIFSMSPGTNTVGAFLPEKPFPESDNYVHQLYPDALWKEREFLASTDERFRPVNASMGPDGCLYVVDFYRGVIQHKRFLTSYLRRQSAERELDKPIGLGRIYRIVPDHHEKIKAPDGLVAGLSHPYLWWRLRSQKRIVEGDQKDFVDEIQKLAHNKTASPHGRVHAMWALAGLGKLKESTVVQAIEDKDWFISMTGLRLAGESKGVADFFPDEFKSSAEKVFSRKNIQSVLASYAGLLSKSGYPSRSVNVYKDKEADWVKNDKNLLSAYRKGRDQYAVSCGACHQADGKGLPNMAPTLAKSDWVTGDSTRLIGVAVHGLMGPIKVNGKAVENVPPIMPAHGFMKNEQLADILTYVRNAWGNRSSLISAKDVMDYRVKESTRITPWIEAEFN
ncbi:MAG: c-type cytochrome [Verrucomicrobiota bacterium]|nr:c-type cytochrome [Verrucomicrobiota bacterium]